MALTNTVKTQLYQFFTIAFDAAPGVTYMSQLADAYLAGISVPQIVEVFTTKPQFTSVYPSFLTTEQFAVRLVNNVVGTSASDAAKAEAVADITAALASGFTRGKVIYQVFSNLGAKIGDEKWGGTAQQMANQVEYAKYFTETLAVDTTDLKTLQAVIAGVTPSSSTSEGAIQSAISQVLNPTYNLSVKDVGSVSEGSTGTRFMPFQLELSGTPSTDIVVSYSITGGTATSGEDYQDTTGTVTIAAGQRTATVNVPIIGDRVAEADETIQLTFTGARLNASITTAGTIKNDDAAPVFTTDKAFAVGENGTTVGMVAATDADGDSLSYSIVGGADAALFSINASTGALTFKSAPNFEKAGDAGANNVYDLTVSAGDGSGNSGAQAITVTVGNQNDAPMAGADAANALTGVLKAIDVLAADSDEDAGDTKTLVSVTQPTKGGVAVINDGKVDYTAVAYAGEETFTYTMKDSKGVESSATVTVTVSPNIASTDGADTLFGTTGAEKIDGGLGNDTIFGGGGADSLIGNEGDDRILYRDSAALIQGGNGTDTLVIDASALGARFALASADNQVTDATVKNLVVRGMDNIDATGSSNAITIDDAAAGTTLLQLTSQADTVATMEAVTGNVTVVAGAGDDSVTTGAVAATATVNVDAGDGADTVDAGASLAAVTITGGAGNDTVNVGDAGSNVDAGAGNDAVTAGAGNDVVSGGDGADEINAGDGDNSVDGGVGDDELTTGADDDMVAGGAGDDIIDAGDGANNVTGGDGADAITTGAGADIINSGAGDDTVKAGDGANNVSGGDGADTITAGTGDDTVDGGAGADAIDAGSGKNSITGDAGNDTITIPDAAALGANTLVDGGADTDTLVISSNAGETLADLALAKALGIEALTLGTGNDTVTLAVNANATGLTTITAGAGDDVINTSDKAYTLNAVVNAGDGNDQVTTGTGNDTVTIGAGTDSVDAGAGNDTVVGGANVTDADVLTGGDGTDVLTLNAGATAGKAGAATGTNQTSNIAFDADFTGFEAITLAAGAASADSAAAGEDVAGATSSYVITLGDATNVAAGKSLTVDAGALRADVITGIADSTADTDAIINIGESDTLGSETLTLTATAIKGSVNVIGGAGDDAVTGSAQADTISGNAGADDITGGGGADSIDGGAGADVLKFASAAHLKAAATVVGGADADTIQLTADAITLTDAEFANVSTVESLATANGANSVSLGTNAENAGVRSVTGGTGADAVSASGYASAGVTLSGGAGNDTLTGSAQADSLNGGGDNDNLAGGAGNDTLTGGAGDDTVSGGDGNDSISTAGADVVDAGAGDDTVTLGDATSVKVTLFAGNDTVVGGAFVDGDDTLSGGEGTDVLTLNFGATAGKAGDANGNSVFNWINFDADFTGFETITLAAGPSSVDSAESGKDVAGAVNWYDLSLTDSSNVAAGQVLTVDASALRGTVITGIGDGSDSDAVINIGENDVFDSDRLGLDASAVKGSVSVLGGGGDDLLILTAQADTVDAGAGDDLIEAGDGANLVQAGSGDDQITSGAGADTIDGGAGSDNITSGAGADFVTGGAGNDVIDGGDGSDSLSGGDGDDEFMFTRAQLGGGGAADTVDGGAGTDSLTVDSAAATEIDDVFLAVRFTSIEAINLDGTGAYTYTAGTYSQAAGIRTITVGSSGASKISVSQYTVGTTLVGGDGSDTLTGSALSDNIAGGSGNDSIVAGDGNDTIAGGTNADTIEAGPGNDTITTQGADSVTASTGDDLVTLGDGGNVNVTLGDGNDTLAGGSFVDGADTLSGGDGNDLLTLNAGATAGKAGAANGTNQTSTITFDQDFTGFETITLAAGAASVDSADAGKDVAGATNSYVITLGDATNVDAGKSLKVDAGALRAGVITVIGDGTDSDAVINIGESDTPGSETLTLTATAVKGTLNVIGGAGNDTITLGAQADTVDAGLGNDTISVGDGANSVMAGGGNDTVTSGAGADTIDGADGNDSITSGAGADVVTAGAGNNVVDAGDGNDSVTAGAGNDSITGGAGNDTVSADEGNDTVNAGTGVDVIDLAGGSDVLVYTAVADSTGVNFDDVSNFTSGTDRLLVSVTDGVSGGADTLDLSGFAVVPSFADGLVSLAGNATTKVFSDAFYSSADGKLYVDTNGDGQINQGNDLIVKIGSVAAGDLGFSVDAGTGADAVTGGAGADALSGGDGNDTLSGGAGNDTLAGGLNDDSLVGGAGNDAFVFATGDTGLTVATADRVTDFVSGADRLALGLAGAGDNFNAAGAAVADFDAATTAANAALATLNAGAGDVSAQLYAFQFDATNGYLFIDRNSDGVADEVVVLVGVGSVAAADIVGGP